jgi:hypothetical protein
MNAVHPLFADILRPFAPPLSELSREAARADLDDQYRTGLDCASDEDEYESRAWRGCLGDRAL